VKALFAENCTVQLVHDPSETTWEDHGFVKVKGADGRVLAESKDYQHNPFYYTSKERTEALMESAVKAGLRDLHESKEEAVVLSPEGSTASPSEDGSQVV
jgi:hypothetical protein